MKLFFATLCQQIHNLKLKIYFGIFQQFLAVFPPFTLVNYVACQPDSGEASFKIKIKTWAKEAKWKINEMSNSESIYKVEPVHKFKPT